MACELNPLRLRLRLLAAEFPHVFGEGALVAVNIRHPDRC